MSASSLTIPELIKNQSEVAGSRVALACADGFELSYTDLNTTLISLISSIAELGVKPRTSRIAVVIPNGIHVAIGILASLSAAVCVPMSPHATLCEYRSWFQEARITHLMTLYQSCAAAYDVAKELGLPVLELRHGLGGYQITGATAPSAAPLELSTPLPNDVAVALMTSGSTGIPKRVPLTHTNLLAGATSVASSLELNATDRVLAMWEQYHIGGVVDLLLAPLASGGTVVFAGGFNATRFYELLDWVRPTWFQGVPTTLRELLVHARLTGCKTIASSLRLVRSVAAPLSPELMQELEMAFGIPVIQTFGMTEASPLITSNLLPPGTRKPGSTGRAINCEVNILNAAGLPVDNGTIGEIAVRGPNIFDGYEEAPETNARVFRHGWFMTGDMGWLDTDQFLFLTGRVKELINRGGEKIAPAEIEQIASLHPAISQAAAFAIPHSTLGEDVALAVVLSKPREINRDAIRSHIRLYLSDFKVPTVVLVLEKLPLTPIGRINRRALAELVSKPSFGVFTSDSLEMQSEEDDPLVMSLAAIWALHLDLPSVSPDADFGMLGGDSLSRIRLLFAVESLCGVSLPNDSAMQISTARQMADDIRRLGGHVAFATPGMTSLTNRRPVDLWGDVNTLAIADGTPADIHKLLSACQTLRELEVAWEALLNILTIEELAAVARLKIRNPLWSSKSTFWRKQILATAALSQEVWIRERLAPSVMFYRRSTVNSHARRLVVGFAGNQQRLMLPTHMILQNLPHRDDLLLLADPSRRHFACGLPSMNGGIQEICNWLSDRIPKLKYDSVIGIGTSGGGLASICAAYALGMHQVVAIAADSPANHPDLEDFLLDRVELTVSPRRHPQVLVIYDSENMRDREGGEKIAAILPSCDTLIPSGSGEHNVLRSISASGQLAPFFKLIFNV